jgi:prefoldin subunit 5
MSDEAQEQLLRVGNQQLKNLSEAVAALSHNVADLNESIKSLTKTLNDRPEGLGGQS